MKINKIYITLLLCCIGIIISSCDATIHEYPKTVKLSLTLQANVHNDNLLSYKQVSYDDEGVKSIVKLDETPVPLYKLDSSSKMRIIYDVYRGKLCKGNNCSLNSSNLVKSYSRLVKWDKSAWQDTAKMSLPIGDYYVVAWADYLDNINSSVYNTEVLDKVESNYNFVPRNLHMKNAFSGLENFSLAFKDASLVAKYNGGQLATDNIIPINLNRVVARYRLVTNDYKEFIANGGSLNGVTVKVVYKRYITIGYNALSHSPNKFIETYTNNAAIMKNPINENECSIYCDYILSHDDKEDNIVADFYFYDSNGKLINKCSNIEIPLLGNHETVVKTAFLTKLLGTGDGIKINEGFNDEYVVNIDN